MKLVVCSQPRGTWSADWKDSGHLSPVLNRDGGPGFLALFWYQTWRNLLKNASFCPRILHLVKRDARVTFDIFAFGGTDLRYSKLFIKTISRAKKSTSKVKIGKIVYHTVLFLKRSRHLGYPDYLICYGGSKSVWDAIIGFQASVI